MSSRSIFTLRFSIICILSAIVLTLVVSPFIITGGTLLNKSFDAYDENAHSVIAGYEPGSVYMTDAQGTTIATLFDQERIPVNFQDISPNMIKAILSIEDHRFTEHNGVDWEGTIRAFLENFSSGHVKQGASTLTQQYVKNYLLLVTAQSDQERAAAIAETPTRKLHEAQLALTLERNLTDQGIKLGLSPEEARINTKKQILTRYLNLVYFGNEIYGVQRAAQFYFRHSAKDLTIAESAMLAGMLQSTALFNPYTHPAEVLTRRNTVLDTMITNFPASKNLFEAAKQTPLGITPHPQHMGNLCISASGNGYFCDYVLQYLAKQGFSINELEKRSIKIRTTLDSRLQNRTVTEVQSIANPHLDSIAEVINLLKPGEHSHDILAMVSSRNYGLDESKNETQLPEPDSLVGDGAGSVFKIFTVAAAMEEGMGTKATMSVPANLAIQGLGFTKSDSCPKNTYCVKNAGNYRKLMSLKDALATSPNTAFVRLLRDVGVSQAVDMSVKLGMRSYAEPGTSIDGEHSIADFVKGQNLGSFTLGPVPVNDLELSNVADTLASHGVWCPPNPIISLEEPEHDAYGAYKFDTSGHMLYQSIKFTQPECQQVVPAALADTLSNALSGDSKKSGTSANSAARAGWIWPVSSKTGTTETHRSAAFLGYTQHYAGAVYLFGDNHPQPICTSPLRTCTYGNVYGGQEPAYTWYRIMAPIANQWGKITLPTPSPTYVNGSSKGAIPYLKDSSLTGAIHTLTSKGFKYEVRYIRSIKSKDTVIDTAPKGFTIPGGTITLITSNGKPPADIQPILGAGELNPHSPHPITPPGDQAGPKQDSDNNNDDNDAADTHNADSDTNTGTDDNSPTPSPAPLSPPSH